MFEQEQMITVAGAPSADETKSFLRAASEDLRDSSQPRSVGYLGARTPANIENTEPSYSTPTVNQPDANIKSARPAANIKSIEKVKPAKKALGVLIAAGVLFVLTIIGILFAAFGLEEQPPKERVVERVVFKEGPEKIIYRDAPTKVSSPTVPGNIKTPDAAATESEETVNSQDDARYLESIAIITKLKRQEVKRCYLDQVATNPPIKGLLAIDMTISKRGGVTKVAVARNTLVHAPTIRCITKTIYAWSFPKPPRGGIVYNRVFRFKKPPSLRPKKIDTNPF